MRRVDAEGDSRGVQGQAPRRLEAGSRLRLRRAAIEWLERRELLSTSTSTLPSPTVLSAPSIANQTQDVSLASSAPNLTATPDASTPSVSVDPINPLKMVATWTEQDSTGYDVNFVAPITSYIEGAYSLDGGKTWTALPAAAFGGVNDFGETVNVQGDSSITSTTQFPAFTETTDASVGFDRNENFYILSSTHNTANTAGVLDLQRFSFVGTNTPTYNGFTPIYSWDGVDGGVDDEALTPTLAVDTNLASFTDASTGTVQTDQYSGNIYAVWAEVDTDTSPGPITNFNPNTIRMSVSSDQGLEFTHAAYVDDSSNANGHNTGVVTNPPPPQYPLHDSAARYVTPQVTISQGNGTVPGGQVTIVYDDYGTVAPLAQILAQTDLIGGTSEQFSYTNAQDVFNINQEIPIAVNITDPKFTTLQDLDVTNTVAWPNISEIAGVLIPPASVVTYLQKKLNDPFFEEIVLFDGDFGVEASGTPLSTANLGLTTGTGFGAGSGTVFDPEAVRSVEDGSVKGTAVGHYMPDDEEAFLLLKGLSANPVTTGATTLPGLNGIWNYEVVQIASDTSTLPKFVNGVTLNFTSGDNPGAAAGAAGAEVTVAGKNSLFEVPIPDINPTNTAAATAYPNVTHTDNTASPLYDGIGGTFITGNPDAPILSTVEDGIPLLPAPVIASDNTLGSFSQHPGRLYVSFTGMFSDAEAGDSNIFLTYSDDGGKTWSNPTQVNDDNAATDGYSGSTPGGTLGRTQFQPQIDVDQSTGDVVLSFLDARNDPSNARVATYVAVSENGGSTFAADVYANSSQVATDAVTGDAVNLGPVPDNESAGSGIVTVNGYGTHQALVVTNGKIIPFWTSNENTNVKTAIVDSIMALSAGPRIISSTQGPVGGSTDTLNTTRAADGTPLANSILVTFDQGVDPTTFLTTNVVVDYKAPTGGASISLPIVSVTPVAGTTVADTEFKIVFNPASLAGTSFVGTYSYEIIPTGIRSRSRTANAPTVTAGVFAFVSPTGTAVTDNNDDGYTSSSITVTGHPNQFLIANPTGTNNLVNAAYPTGNVAGTLTATISAGAEGDAEDDFTVNLVTPDGQRIPITGTFSPDGTTETFTATKFTVPWVNTVPLDGNYTLEVIDNPNQDPITISAWHLTLNGQVATASSKLGNVMDQNADGTSGQLTGDKISSNPFNLEAGDHYVVGQPTGFANYATNTIPLIVSGPHIASTVAVDSTGSTISTGTTNLVLNNTVSSLLVTWDRNILVSSFSTLSDQILSIMGPAGAVSLTGLTITPVTVFTAAGQVAYSNGATADAFEITFATQQISGTYTLTIGTGIQAADGSGVDANENAGLDVLRGTATNGITTPVSYAATSTAVPATIAPATVNGLGVTVPSVLMSPIVVPVDFPIQGDNGTVSGITLTLNISYSKDPDLIAYLLSPDGTQINLFTNVGAGTNTANFTNTTLSDTASTSIDKAGAPFFGTFLPEAPFANLATAGEDSLGTWQLVIENGGNSTGTLNSWSLTFQKPVSSTGLAEFPDDQSHVSFQIFNLAASNSLANSTWTAVGPAGITPTTNGTGTFAGEVSTVAVDPSDTTGNTVYVGSASGGVWKTTDFLTTAAQGPTYIPLTQFGSNFSLNIGSIAVFGKNDDPAQSIIFAGTGFGQEATTADDGSANVDLNSGRGVGILRSVDGGVTWTLLDSLDNVDANGNELAEASRDHNFVGDTTYKIVVDPTANLDGQVIVYAALGGPTGGLYQSLDSGNTWHLLQAGNCTDILLDPNSKSPTTGNLDTLYAAFSTAGVYVSTNQGQTLQLMTGQLGKDPLIVGPGFPAQPITVGDAATTPNFIANSYIVLAKPALTGSISENLDYEGWLYAAVENGDGTFNGLYVTKDAGENWTLVQLANIPGAGSVKAAVPTNDTTGVNSYDPTSSKFNQEGAYNLTLTVDPTNPNIVYIGGSQDFQGSGMIRVDLTDLHDAHNFTSFSTNRTDGGLLTVAAQGGVTVANPANGAATYEPIGQAGQSQILNLRYAPNNGTPGTSPFNINATLVVANVAAAGFLNDGTGVTWSLFDEPLKANAGDPTGSTNVHDVIDYVDPTTGDVRLLIADDEGVFTALTNTDGTLNNGIGSDVEVNYSRNGNLQDEQILDSAAEPSYVSTQAAGALFYASGQSNLAAQSAANILTTGNLTWSNTSVLDASPTSPRSTTANSSIDSSDRSGVGIATDQTGATNSLYEFDVPILGGNLTDFFRVNQFGQTTGLANNVNAEYPQHGTRGDAQTTGFTLGAGVVDNGQIPVGNFAVNPLNGNQILIGSATGNIYETTNQGILFTPIGNAGNFQVNSAGGVPTGIQFSAIVYGAPDPNVSGGVGNLNNFIYVGTTGSPLPAGQAGVVQGDGLLQNDGRIFLTQAGGQGWIDASKGLDGSSIVGIYPDPDRGSHAAYAVTLTGVFYSPDTVALAKAGQTVWTNITSNLTSIQYDAFGDSNFQQSVLAQFVGQSGTSGSNSDVYTAQYGGFTSIVADYRYEIPAPTNATEGTNIFYPVLYVSGYGGVFRSIDNGVTWTVFPNTAFDAAPVDGGYLPSVDVTNLQLVLGDINPATGHATQNSNSTVTGATPDPEILLASTFGAGDYAIRLAPDVIPDSVVFDTTLPEPDGSDSSQGALITNVTDPYIDGISEVTNYGDTVTINLFDESPGSPYFGTKIGTGTTNALGQFVVQILPGSDPWFNSISSTAVNDKVVGIQATDSSGASGNLTLFKYTLDLITPVTPDAPVLEATYDSGRSSTDGLTDLSVPPQAGPGAPLNIVTPTFDVTTNLPQANPLSPDPISLTIELLQATSPNGPFFVVNSTQTGFINGAGTAETYMLTDPTIAALAAAGIDETFYYEALQIDEAGNVSQPASNVEAVTVNTIVPVAPGSITLVTQGNSTPPMPVFNVTGILPGDQVLLYRSINNGAPIEVGVGAINTTNGTVTLAVTDTTGASPDGVYTYYAAQQDVYGNFSPLTPALVVIINTQPAPSTPVLEAAYDTGRYNFDDVTNIAVPAPTPGSAPNYVVPVFDVTATAPAAGQPAIATVELYRSTTPNGTYTLVGTTAYNGNPAMVTDASLQSLVSTGPIDQFFYYEADQVNTAGITSRKSSPLIVLVDTITPPTLPAPTLDPSSNTGLNKSSLITNQTKPVLDFTNLLTGEQAFLYRSTGGKAAIRVGTGPINLGSTPLSGTIQDTTGAVPDGVYQYYIVQQDQAGNISALSPAIPVTVNTTTPAQPTIALLASDDTGLPLHPDVTSVNMPHFTGTAPYNSVTPLPVYIVNVATGAILNSAPVYPAANGTYLAQVNPALADGVYTVEAVSFNVAGTPSFSAPLTVTIKHNGPKIPPNLTLSSSTDTGTKGDGVTSNHAPKFVGTTDPGDVVSLYVLINGVLTGPEATTTSSTTNGSFTFQLPFNLTDGTTQLVAQTSDVANNKGPLSSAYTVQITTTTGDYIGTGKAQLTVFDPYNETYYVRNTGAIQVDATPGRDVPVQYDYNGDGSTDLAAYRYDSATYYGFVSNGTAENIAYGPGGSSLPVSGYYGDSGTFIFGSYQPVSGTWFIALPQANGLVVNFGVPKVDIPAPAAYDGYNSTELAVFRNTPIFGGDADSFSVIGPQGFYMVSFTSPAVEKLGFTFKAGDIAAPADYDGVGHDEFAIYRPSTGQFFILNTPSDTNTATWTLRTVTMNLPGGPNVNDVPVSQDYDGDGKADPTVYRTSNSTFYMLQSSTGLQVNIPFGPAGQSVAAGGPVLYRLTALFGQYASNGGYYTIINGNGNISTGGGGQGALSIGGGGGVRAESITSSSSDSSSATASTATPASAGSPLATMIAVAAPLPVTTAPTTAATTSTLTSPTTSIAPSAAITVGVATPRSSATLISGPKVVTSAAKAKPKKAAKTLVVETQSHEAELKAKAAHAKALATAHAAALAKAPAKPHASAPKSNAKAAALSAASLQHLVMATKGGKKKS